MTCKEIKILLDKESGLDISVKSNLRTTVQWRFLFVYLCLKYSTEYVSYKKIGETISRHHATAINCSVQFNNLYETNIDFREFCNTVINKYEKELTQKQPIEFMEVEEMSLLKLKRRLKNKIITNNE